MKQNAKLSGIALIAAMGVVSCSTDELQEINAGEGISFTTQVSRATPLTLEGLDGFYVYADADGYPQMFIDSLVAKKDPTSSSGIYLLDKKVTWPTGVDTISFWAYGPLAAKDYLKPSITTISQQVQNYKVAQSVETGGAGQNDFVVTYAKAIKTPGNQVALEFHHALSQIEIKAKLGADLEEGRRVKVKGAWLVNINSTADLTFDKNVADLHYMNWEKTANLVSYGCSHSAGSSLSQNSAITIVGNDGSNQSSLMLIPQKRDKYAFAKAAADPSSHEGAIATAETSTGAYILVLCRVETYHNSPVTEAGAAENPAIKVEGDGHVHQLFPYTYNDKKEFVYQENAYGYTCVPVDVEWKPGKKYVYTLQFCGRGSGAGQYPPAIPDVLPKGDDIITTPEDGKKPGDNVLENEITFKVEVSDWTEESVDTKMD